MEECVFGMVQRSGSVAVKDAQIMLRREECAGGMGQRVHQRNGREERMRTVRMQRSGSVAVKDAQILL